MSKGSKRRPMDEKAFAANWDRIFSKECAERGCAAHDDRIDKDSVKLVAVDPTEVEARFFAEIVARLQQGGQAGAVGILQHWIKERSNLTI